MPPTEAEGVRRLIYAQDRGKGETMNYQWYPGHMTKAMRMMQENIKLVDLVIELVDARIPLSSRNPDIDKLRGNKAGIVLLNKADLADEAANALWLEAFKEKGLYAAEVNSRSGAGVKAIRGVVAQACQEKKERDRKRGILNRPVRAMVAGIPNVGKSTFINAYAGRACAKTGNKPGVTKGKQWIRLDKDLELLDTPGVLWPKFEDQRVGLYLALIGSINDEILQMEELAAELTAFLKKEYPGALSARYHTDEAGEGFDILADIALRRGCLLKGGRPDIRKAAYMLMEEFRNGKLGRFTLERPLS